MQKKAYEDLVAEVQELRIQLEEAEETLNAIRRGEVDGLVVSTQKGEQIYSISGADRPYRVLIEGMREGAVMLSIDNTVLYCNSGFAKMIKRPIDKIVGSYIQNIVLPTHLTDFEELLSQGRTGKGGKAKEITLLASDDKPVQTLMTISAFLEGSNETTFLVATDLTEHMEEDIKRYTNKLETEITERKKAEEKLIFKERELASIYVSVPDVLFFLSVEPEYVFRFLSVSQSFLRVTGLKEKQVVGKTVQEVIPEPSLSLVLEKYTQAICERKTVRWEEITDYPLGKKYGEVAATPFFDSSGRCTNLIGTVYDITDRKKAEERIRRQINIQEGTTRIFEEALRNSTEKALGEVCLLVAEEVTQSKFGFIGEINEKGLEDIVISNPGWDACKTISLKGHGTPVGSLKIQGIYGKVIVEGKGFFTNDPAKYIGRVGLPVGHPPLKSFLGVPLLSEGKTIGLVAVGNREGGYRESELEALEVLASAVVEAFLRKRAEDALKKSEEHYRSLFVNMEEGFSFNKMMYGEAGKPVDFVVLEANKVFEDTTGLKREKVVGKRLHDAYPKAYDDIEFQKIFQIFAKVAETGDSERFELYSRSMNKWLVGLVYSPMKGYFAVLDEDVTQRKLTEKKLDEYRNNLEKLVEERTKQLKDSERLAAIGATAGMVGHDIRNPLQAITGDVYLAKMELASIPESDEKKGLLESLQEIEKNTEYINKIVADLQDFAKPLKPNSEVTDLKLLIEELLKKNGLPKNVKVSVKVEPDARNVIADHTFINRIMYNLVNNAVQAMPDGGKLTLHSFKEANDAIISVKDTGVGIPEAAKGKLFTPMFTTKAKGQGFGLAVIKRITESLGGTVTFKSQEGKGTTFIIRLPQNKK